MTFLSGVHFLSVSRCKLRPNTEGPPPAAEAFLLDKLKKPLWASEDGADTPYISADWVRCSFFNRNWSSRMPLDHMPRLLGLKLLHACDQMHASRVSTLYQEEEEDVYIKLAETASMRCEENLRGRSEYPITNTDMVHSP
jgi:hypothetical protein